VFVTLSVLFIHVGPKFVMLVRLTLAN